MEAVQARCAVKGVADSLVALIPDIEEGFPHGVHPRCPPEHRKTARRVMLSQVHTGFLHPLQILLTFEQGNGVTAVVLPAEQSCEPHRGSHANGLNPSKKLISLDTDPRDVMLNGSVWLLIVSPGFGIEHVTDKGLAAGLSSVQTTSGELLVLMETGGALASIEHGELPRLWRMLLRCDERGRSCPPTTLPLVVSPEMQTFFALPE
ncbi:hypothetical protein CAUPRSCDRAFT_12797 [Caulochytrium protostelioides]|uniref:Uncharacterized protein n=1 Tax=Caulochytrium protostelioides TaxID=1555241 RepID=A0A4P9WS89_9FUNG|nr:hypothetical protein CAUPRSCDRAFT_12797 [Caulochytrium protostelioides]